MSGGAAHAEGGHGTDTEKVDKGMAWLNKGAGQFVDGAIGGPMRATARLVGATLGQIGDEKNYIVNDVFGIETNPNNGLSENLVDATAWVGDQLKAGVKGLSHLPFAVLTNPLGRLGNSLQNVPVARNTLAPILNFTGWVGRKIGGGTVFEKNPDGTPKMHNGHQVEHEEEGLLQKCVDIGFMPVRMLKRLGHGVAKAVGSIPVLAQTAALLTLIGPGSVYNFKEHHYGTHAATAPAGGAAAHPPAAGGAAHHPPAAGGAAHHAPAGHP